VTVAFAMSGGANLGPMQAGTLLALAEADIRPDLLVGTSVGALNAAFLSTRPGVEGARALRTAWSTLRRKEAFRFNPLAVLAGFVGLRDALVSARHLGALIGQWVEVERIEDARVPFAATATDALTGEPVVLRSGDVVRALTASTAIPGLLPPVLVEGRWLVDGSLSANVPVTQAQDLGADEVYLITTDTARRHRPPRGAVALAMNSVSQLTARSGRHQLALALERAERSSGRVWVVPSAEPVAPGPFDFSRAEALADAAYTRASEWLRSERSRPAASETTARRGAPPTPGGAGTASPGRP
jgi:NTE family protein